MPGASSQITIRGARSFTGDNTPLYVVDGMPISSTADFNVNGNGITGSDYSNRAIDIARELIGFIPVIYSAADVTSAVGYRLKCQFNENSKLHAFHNVIPELNHNEIIGWESFQDKQFNAKLILILDKIYHPQIKKRFDITASLISSDKIYLESNEEDFKLRLMDLIYLGDWISYYLALFRGFDPTEIENINILKEKLA